MLEGMAEFFAARLDGYDEHMRRDIEGAAEFYLFTAALLPKAAGTRLLDLGCGTGLELEDYFRMGGEGSVTGIDLSPEMLAAMAAKFPGRDLTLIRGSYLTLPLGEGRFDTAVSVESLHHFPAPEKLALYEKLRRALTESGYFVLTDYFAASDEEENAFFGELARLRREQGIGEGVLCHYDTPLTAAHEMALLRRAGFTEVRVLKSWAATSTLLARCEETKENDDKGECI